MHSKLTVNNSNAKVYDCRDKIRINRALRTTMSHFESRKKLFKYLRLEVPSNDTCSKQQAITKKENSRSKKENTRCI